VTSMDQLAAAAWICSIAVAMMAPDYIF